ncbi:MAG: hypothetical protein JJE05_09550 [Actinobacteria bacterium]|nr:hypothetical protein [Actinomycetota bacterium]
MSPIDSADISFRGLRGEQELRSRLQPGMVSVHAELLDEQTHHAIGLEEVVFVA